MYACSHEIKLCQCHSRCEQNAPLRKLGGPGTIVEIDESLLFKRKYNVGQLMQNQRLHIWILGMVERGTNKIVLEKVDNRNQATLIPLITQWVLPGTDIMTDMWGGYGNIPAAYRHWAVNHRVCFVHNFIACPSLPQLKNKPCDMQVLYSLSGTVCCTTSSRATRTRSYPNNWSHLGQY